MNKFRRYRRRLRGRLVSERGGACEDCGSQDELEFAHVKPTSVNGKGRGSFLRYADVRRHPDCYRLLCNVCHNALDLGLPRPALAVDLLDGVPVMEGEEVGPA